MIKFYYGLSGTFKGTTIKSQLNSNTIPVWSMIKTWKRLETGIFSGLVSRNDLNYALQHLCLLEYVINNNYDNKTILVERGVSDMSYYRMKMYESVDPNASDEWIKKSIREELKICQILKGQTIHKILLIQNDKDWIRDVILKEPTRREVFPGGLDEYLKNQDEYIKFTEKYNSIDEIITINNSRSYIESLGIEYNEELCKKS